MGRILSNINDGLNNSNVINDTLLSKNDFNAFKFYEVSTGRPYHIENSPKQVKIFLLYYYSSGRLFDKSFKEIFEFANDHKDRVEVRVIPMDKIVYTQ